MPKRRFKRLLIIFILYGVPAVVVGRYGFYRYVNLRLAGAVTGGNAAEARRWLALGADPDCRYTPPTAWDRTPVPVLFLAVWSRHEQAAISLIEGGASLKDTEPRTGRTILDAAISSHNPTIVRALLDHKVDPDARHDYSPYPSDAVDREIYRLLRSHGGDISLAEAMSMGDLNAALADLRKGADTNATDRSGFPLLHSAAAAGDIRFVTALLNGGAKVDLRNRQGGTALMSAVYSGRTQVIQALLDHGADVNARSTDGETALMRAGGRPETVRLLLIKGADPNIRANNGQSAASYAGMSRERSTYEILRKRGARISLQDALANDDAPTVRRLLRGGADANQKDRLGFPALHLARCLETSGALLEAGADVDARNPTGWTPLMIAVLNRNVKVAQFLVDHGANLDAKGLDGRRLFSYFDRFPDRRSIVDHLRRRRANHIGPSRSVVSRNNPSGFP